MAICKNFIATITGCIFVLLTSHFGVAQNLRIVSETNEFTDYEFENNNLKITTPEYLMVPFQNGEARFRVMEQDIREVTVDSSHFHYAENPEVYLITGRSTPVIQTGDPGFSRDVLKIPLTIHVARQNEAGSKTFQVLRFMRIRVYHDSQPAIIRKEEQTFSQTVDSPLSSGPWFKIPIPEDDIYALDFDYLESLGLDVSSINPRNIQIWSTDGYELPHLNSDPRPDFTQVPIIVQGESNSTFNSNDRVIFFANGPNRTWFNQELDQFEHRLHKYSNSNYVFLTIGSEAGVRLTPTVADGSPTRDVTSFRDFRWLEEDREKSESSMKSGTQWFGQGFDPINTATQTIFTDTLAGFQQGSDIEIWFSMAARSTLQSRFSFVVNGSSSIPDISINTIQSITRSTGISANITQRKHILDGFSLPDDVININATYHNSQSAARGWVNWIRIRADRSLTAHENYLLFYPPEDGDGSTIRYRLNGFNSEPLVMDITDPTIPVLLAVNSQGSEYLAVWSSESNRRFIARSDYRRPLAGESISNQNIRNPSGYPDYVIITASEFLEEAQRLADYRQTNDGLTPVIVTQPQVFNEFNGGVPDFVALRDYVKYLYDRGTAAGQNRPEYLLLFGGTTYDYKGIISNPGKQNYVFTFQSDESINRTNTYGSDDFFGFMGEDEGLWPRNASSTEPRNYLDIGIGRLSIQSAEEARLLVDKIINYEDPRNRGDWQSIFTFLADDHRAGINNDRDLHILNAEGTADVINLDETGIRLEKLYQITYPTENTSGGLRVPDATQSMINRINDGTLVFNFSGHGSEQQLTHQRLFTSDDISRLHNQNKLSIMVTATCSFGRFDDTEDNSGAEKLLLHSNGGTIAAFTTTRVVFTSIDPTTHNFGLNIALTREMTRRDVNGRPQRLGDIYRKMKLTTVGSEFNARKFILLGDPAMRIGLPESQINISHINGVEIRPDTLFNLRALDKVSISGNVMNPNGAVNTSFNGEANIRIFDARRMIRYPGFDWVTNGNCFIEECGYFIQTDALFNGRVSVTDGSFQSTFIIPKDVSYSSNNGRIQAYARERDIDAIGSNSSFRIQGRNPDAADDQNGPEIEIHLNDEMFADGGIVNDSPQLIVQLVDDSGINTTGAGVGHEIVAIIEDRDNDSNRKTIALNEFYQSDLDNFTSGRIEYPINGLENGNYRLRIHAWDVFNNLGESEITFQVLDSQDLQIRNIFNYPNPMHNFTSFVFEHNQPGNPMDINIRIYTLSGRPVTTIRREDYISAGNMVRIDWNGRDDDLHRLATGTYLYHIQVRTETGQGLQTQDKIERLVILR